MTRTLVPRLVIAGATSGVGKTTVASGVMAALSRRGLRVQPFKAGPDYIDPSYHSLATGAPSRNLDTWILPAPPLLELFARAVGNADVAVIEGVMGLFDGRAGRSEEGSTSQLAKLLGAPVILVLDVSKMARSAGAMALGYRQFDPELNLAGFLLNRVGSDGHLQMARQAVEDATGLPVVGYLPRRDDIVLPERHLGLVPAVEGGASGEFFHCLAGQVERTVDVPALLAIATRAGPLSWRASGLFPAPPSSLELRIAVAADEAFSFYYQDNLDLLAAQGASIVPFSPIHDNVLPAGVAGVYIGGGFPELYAARLSANEALRQSLSTAIEEGIPVYAECGGLMYLTEGILDFEGAFHAMVGAIPGRTAMHRQRRRLGYATVRARRDNLLLRQGDTVRGHEFHWSDLDRPADEATGAYEVLDQDGRLEGYARENLLGSYIHLHFGSNAGLARNFVAACARWAVGDGNAKAPRVRDTEEAPERLRSFQRRTGSYSTLTAVGQNAGKGAGAQQ
ncbi:MAG: cobyrinate a,c-diamide synthase [Chloroflexi bacterium]|nr:cobyrinate a,c-diamide synthase [Chloroflexota bacterium]